MRHPSAASMRSSRMKAGRPDAQLLTLKRAFPKKTSSFLWALTRQRTSRGPSAIAACVCTRRSLTTRLQSPEARPRREVERQYGSTGTVTVISCALARCTRSAGMIRGAQSAARLAASARAPSLAPPPLVAPCSHGSALSAPGWLLRTVVAARMPYISS